MNTLINIRTIILLLPSFILSAACSEPAKQNKNTTTTVAVTEPALPKEHFKRSEVIPSVFLKNDPAQNFALYLPKSYSDAVKLPVIVFFDPHGDGTVPLNLYHELAEKYNYILVASNDSKNGLSFDETNMIAANLVKECKTRFSVDEKKIAFCGFSGGAKVALMSGATNEDVSAIIYCGAAAQVKANHLVSLLGFAGKKDMNYTDLVSFEWSMEKAPMKHYLIEWNGKHEFPTADVFNDAFIFLSTGDVEQYSRKKVTITLEKVNEEQMIKQKYIEAFNTKDLDWWKAEINSLNTKKKMNPMYERLTGFISLACYSITDRAFQQNNLGGIEKVLAIYKMDDPENKAWKDFSAELQKRKK